MIYSYDFKCIFDGKIIKEYSDKENIDEWGYALITINNKYGAEYNYVLKMEKIILLFISKNAMKKVFGKQILPIVNIMKLILVIQIGNGNYKKK